VSVREDLQSGESTLWDGGPTTCFSYSADPQNASLVTLPGRVISRNFESGGCRQMFGGCKHVQSANLH